MPYENISPEARGHHSRLLDLGVVSRIAWTLEARDDTYSISNLRCWVAIDRGMVTVKAAYMHQRTALTTGKPQGQPVLDQASFRVAADKPFGPLGSPPLPADVIKVIMDMAFS
jgi:hypothetical protein